LPEDSPAPRLEPGFVAGLGRVALRIKRIRVDAGVKATTACGSDLNRRPDFERLAVFPLE
jgi:hypothetical protein